MSTAIAVKSSAAVGYLRVSTMSQAGERHVSLETQESALRAHCTKNGLTLMATFVDFQSGRRYDRLESRSMLK